MTRSRLCLIPLLAAALSAAETGPRLTDDQLFAALDLKRPGLEAVASAVWPELWYRFVPSPSMTDEALITFLKAYVDHARHLMSFHTTGNWLATEGNGLYHAGVLFPEFKDAKEWRDTAARWIFAELDNQVYFDGVQIELASGYHHVSLGNFLAVYKIAKLNDAPLAAGFLNRLDKMYDFDVFGALPDRRLPGVQDGGYYVMHSGWDPGNYTYERSKWRSYFIDSPSHNVVLVDGQPRDSYVCHRVMRFVCGADPLVCGRRPRRPGDSEHCVRRAGPGGPARTGGSAPRRNATLTNGRVYEWKRTK